MSDPHPDLDTLRRAFAAAHEPAASGCPPPERLWAAFHGKLRPAERDALLDHLAVCPACAEDWRLAAAFAHKVVAAEVVPLRRPGVQRVAPWVAVAAAACLVAVVGVEWKAQRDERILIAMRGEQQQGAIRSPLDGGRIPRDRPLLRWSGPPKATYHLLVSTEQLRVLADEPALTRPEYLIPAAKLAGLPAGTKLVWQVEAVLPGGERLPPETFETELR